MQPGLPDTLGIDKASGKNRKNFDAAIQALQALGFAPARELTFATKGIALGDAAYPNPVTGEGAVVVRGRDAQSLCSMPSLSLENSTRFRGCQNQ